MGLSTAIFYCFYAEKAGNMSHIYSRKIVVEGRIMKNGIKRNFIFMRN